MSGDVNIQGRRARAATGDGPGRVARAGLLMLLAWALGVPVGFGVEAPTSPAPGGGATAARRDVTSRVVEIAGRVELAIRGGGWVPATLEKGLEPGDRVRTHAASRAAIQLSDRSVIRLGEKTVVEIRAPRTASAVRAFRFEWGRLFFLNRERPSAIEFETPVAVGAIRGTEFLLEGEEDGVGGGTRLVLFDGAVRLTTDSEVLELGRGQSVQVPPAGPASVTPALPFSSVMQWSFRYPGVLNPGELELGSGGGDAARWEASVAAYLRGDLRGAHEALSGVDPGVSADRRAWVAGLKLGMGLIEEARALLAGADGSRGSVRAVLELIRVVSQGGGDLAGSRTEREAGAGVMWSCGEEMVESYALQARGRLGAARDAVRRVVAKAPGFGYGWVRLAALEMAFGARGEALRALEVGRRLQPANAHGMALEGFLALEAPQGAAAEAWFQRAIELDPGMADAWLGRGLCRELKGDREGMLGDLQVAAALEPQRGVLRSYLGKGFAAVGDHRHAAGEFDLAKRYDPGDPTAWLYSALEAHQMRRANDAVRDLERSVELNDHRGLFRSRLLLDRDLSTRSADLAAMYESVGFEEVSRRSAGRAVAESYANHSGHLFLSRSLQKEESPSRFDLRLETPRQSELLVANLLAPSGGGNLSQLLSQQDHLRYFGPRRVGFSSWTEYQSAGDWGAAATVFGQEGRLAYALDSEWIAVHGQQVHGGWEDRRVSLQLKQDLTPVDSLYAAGGWYRGDREDVARRYDASRGVEGLRARELQEPTLAGGYHHEWGPGMHTLVFLAHYDDDLDLVNPAPSMLFVRRSGGRILDLRTDPNFALTLDSRFALTSVDLQQIWESESWTFLAGSRFQAGTVKSEAELVRGFDETALTQFVDERFERWNGYGTVQWRPVRRLRLTGGLAYDAIRAPRNADLPPLSTGKLERSLLEPRAGLSWDVWSGGELRAAYAQSLGGLYFDNSLRLEPAQIEGFTTAYRSLAPESVAGLVPGTAFEVMGTGFDQRWKPGWYAGVSAERLTSDGRRSVGAFGNATPFPVPDEPLALRETLTFEERNVSGYVGRLVGRDWSLGARARWSRATLETAFLDLPGGTPGLEGVAGLRRAELVQAGLFGIWNHSTGWFARWDSTWWHQENGGMDAGLGSDSFWQHDVSAGYRFTGRRAEIRIGILNLTGTDYRLNPLNLYSDPPRERTFFASLRLNF